MSCYLGLVFIDRLEGKRTKTVYGKVCGQTSVDFSGAGILLLIVGGFSLITGKLHSGCRKANAVSGGTGDVRVVGTFSSFWRGMQTLVLPNLTC